MGGGRAGSFLSPLSLYKKDPRKCSLKQRGQRERTKGDTDGAAYILPRCNHWSHCEKATTQHILLRVNEAIPNYLVKIQIVSDTDPVR